MSAEQQLRHEMMKVILRLSIAEQVRSLRVAAQLSQEKLAAQIGTTQSVISDLENPRGGWPTVSTLERIANFFDVGLLIHFVSWGDFLGWCGESEPPTPFSQEAT